MVAESKFDTISCKRASLANWGHLAKVYENFSTNLRPYVEHIRHERFAFCQREFDSNLQDSLSRITQKEIVQISQFRGLVQAKDCKPIDSSFAVINTGPVAEAALAFMQIDGRFSQNGLSHEFKDKKNGIKVFSREIESFIGDLCRKINREFDTKFEISSFYTGYKDLVENMNGGTKERITNARVCRVFLDNISDVMTKAFDRCKSSNKSLIDLLTGRFARKVSEK